MRALGIISLLIALIIVAVLYLLSARSALYDGVDPSSGAKNRIEEAQKKVDEINRSIDKRQKEIEKFMDRE